VPTRERKGGRGRRRGDRRAKRRGDTEYMRRRDITSRGGALWLSDRRQLLRERVRYEEGRKGEKRFRTRRSAAVTFFC
jgi:hypothetical protein